MRKLLLILFSLLLVGCAAPVVQKTEITLIAQDNFTYEPASITVPVGRPVTLTIKNKGSVEHDFVIEKINIKDRILDQDSGMHTDHNTDDIQYDLHISGMGGETRHVTFTPVSTGTYSFFCTVKGHKEAGMTGVLVVTE